NGDLTDDPQTEWKSQTAPNDEGKQLKQYEGSAPVDIGTKDQPLAVSLGFYRFDKNDEARAALKNILLYYRDYAYEGDITPPGGDKTFKCMLVDDLATGDFRGKQIAALDSTV